MSLCPHPCPWLQPSGWHLRGEGGEVCGNRAACWLVPMLALSSQKGSSCGGCKGVPGPEARREVGTPLLTHLQGWRKGKETVPGAALRTVRFREGPTSHSLPAPHL